MSDEVLETDGEQYDCDTCEVREAQDQLWPENVEAWRAFQSVTSRWLWDCHAVGQAWASLAEDLTHDERIDLLERLGMIYDVLYPPPPPESVT